MKYLRITTALISAAVLWAAPKAANAAYIVQTDSPSVEINLDALSGTCLLYTSPSQRDKRQSRMPSSA